MTLRALVVDDEAPARRRLRDLIAGEPEIELVGECEDGSAAVEAILALEPDVVFLDVQMPEMNGYEVLEALSADPHLRDLPVVMMSSVEEVDSVARCIEMGAEDYLFKPVNPVLLKARIGASLEKKRLRDQQRELFRKFASAEVAEELLTTGLELGGKEVEASVMFSDIRSFTRIAESLSQLFRCRCFFEFNREIDDGNRRSRHAQSVAVQPAGHRRTDPPDPLKFVHRAERS